VTHVPEFDDPVVEQDVRQAVRNLKQGKASGLDGICGEFLKYSENIVAPFLTKLFNKLYDMNVFSSDWCKSVIIPLFKKGDDKIPDNYRGISLLWMSGPMSACLESPHYFCSGSLVPCGLYRAGLWAILSPE